MSLPEYTIKTSPRARHVRFRVTAADGLSVVIPKGFDPTGVPELVAGKQAWIEKTIRNLAEKSPPPLPADFLPGQLDLVALGQTWSVDYETGGKRGRLTADQDNYRLVISASEHQQDMVFDLLLRWLRVHAKIDFVPRVFALADELGFDITRVTIRNQRGRWGSCTSKKTLSLNLKLLFLKPEQVRHVLVHEFCHTTHMNHSRAFWSLVAQFEPAYKAMNKKMKSAWRQVPGWV